MTTRGRATGWMTEARHSDQPDGSIERYMAAERCSAELVLLDEEDYEIYVVLPCELVPHLGGYHEWRIPAHEGDAEIEVRWFNPPFGRRTVEAGHTH